MLSLERKGNLRLLICVVEEWSERGEATMVAQVAQVRALEELCAVDRAWARLSPLLENTSDLPTLQVAAGLLVNQGRVTEARKLLVKARALYRSDPILKQLSSRTDGSGTQIDFTEPNETDVDGRVRQAEHMLREGSPLKARRTLERIQQDFPEHPRVVDLLWASDGEFVLRGVTLTDLARVHAPQLELAGEDEPEHTEHGRPDLVAALLDEDSGHGFPSLFKGLAIEASEASEREVTISSTVEALRPLPEASVGTREDTQIMHVVRRDGSPAAIDTLIDRAPRSSDEPVAGESEDEHVVLRRRTTGTRTPAPVPPRDDQPVQLDPSRDRVAPGASPSDEAADFIVKPPSPAKKVKDTKPRHTSGAPTPRRRDRAFHNAPTMVLEEPAFPEPESTPFVVSWTSWLLLLVTVGGIVLVLGGLLILVQIVANM